MKSGLPSIWLHLVLMIALPFVAAVGLAAMFSWVAEQWEPILGIVGFLAGGITGMLVARAFVKHKLPARCPMCAGPTMYQDGNPIVYTCKTCGHAETTRIGSEGE